MIIYANVYSSHWFEVYGAQQKNIHLEKYFMGRHQSLDNHVKKNMLWIQKLPAVSKIVIGFSESCQHKYSPGHIRFKMDVNGGIKVNAYSGNGVTDIFIKIDPISEREAVKNQIQKRFER